MDQWTGSDVISVEKDKKYYFSIHKKRKSDGIR